MSSRNLEREQMATKLWPATVLLSLLFHGAAYASLALAPPVLPAPPRKTELRFDVVRREPAKPEPPPMPKPDENKPAPKPAVRPKVAPSPAAPPAPAAATAAAALPAGVTLAAGDGSNSFGLPLGDGGALDPQRVIVPEVHALVPKPLPPSESPGPPPPPLVAAQDLSTRPTPPSLGDALERNYPAEARRNGSSGSAKVRARIDPDGVVRQVALLEESGAGFGVACQRTLSGSRWSAPKDKLGRSVATEIRYTCRFVVAP